MHCAGIYPFFLTREVNGVSLADWTESLALGESVPEPQLCEGAQCCEDPVCEECDAIEDEAARPSYCRFCERWPGAWAECVPAPSK